MFPRPAAVRGRNGAALGVRGSRMIIVSRGRCVFRGDGVEPPTTPRLATAYPFHAQPPAMDQSVDLDGFLCVMGAGRRVSASARPVRGDRVLVEGYELKNQPSHHSEPPSTFSTSPSRFSNSSTASRNTEKSTPTLERLAISNWSQPVRNGARLTISRNRGGSDSVRPLSARRVSRRQIRTGCKEGRSGWLAERGEGVPGKCPSP